jgi:hypothetical protein
MQIRQSEARRLCSLREWALVQTSFPPKVDDLPKSRLKLKVSRSRKLRQKYTDLGRRQDAQSQPRRTGMPMERFNMRTKRKAKLFTETLGRFEARLKKIGVKSHAESSKEVRRRKPVARKRIHSRVATATQRRQTASLR